MPRPRGGAVVYTVRPGDTLSGLAEERGTSVAHLQKLNGLAAADVLLLPSWSA